MNYNEDNTDILLHMKGSAVLTITGEYTQYYISFKDEFQLLKFLSLRSTNIDNYYSVVFIERPEWKITTFTPTEFLELK